MAIIDNVPDAAAGSGTATINRAPAIPEAALERMREKAIKDALKRVQSSTPEATPNQ